MTLGTFISYGVGLAMMYQPFKRATRTNLALQQALASARRLFEVLDAPNDVRDRPDAQARRRLLQARSSSRVCPSLTAEGEPVLERVDLALRSRLGHGARGSLRRSGRPRSLALLPRFMDPTAGRVTLDGIDLRDVTLASLRAHIGLVTQDVVLFDETVRRNVAYGRPELAEEGRPRRPRRRERVSRSSRPFPTGSTPGWGKGARAFRAASASGSRSRARS